MCISRYDDLVGAERITTNTNTPITYYHDGFGNVCGRDAADVSLSTSFGRTTLTRFEVYTDEVDHLSAEASVS